MKRWNWALAWAVLRGRVVRIERRIDVHEDTIVITIRGRDGADFLRRDL